MPKTKSLDASLALLGDSGTSLQADRKLSQSLNEARRRCLDAAEKLSSDVCESALETPFSSSRSPNEIRAAIHEAADRLAREFKSFSDEFPNIRRWWQKSDVSRLYELLDSEVWAGKPLVELRACKDATRQQRQAFCEIAVQSIEGKLNQASLDRVLATVDPTWVSYIVPVINIMTGGQPRVVEDAPHPAAIDDKMAVNSVDLMWVAVAAGGETGAKIVVIAQNKELSTQEKLEAIYALDNTKLGWKPLQWAELLGVSRQAVEKTDWWQHLKPELEKDDR